MKKMKKMKKYIVTVKETTTAQYRIEAIDEETASERFGIDGVFMGDGEIINTDIVKIELDKYKD